MVGSNVLLVPRRSSPILAISLVRACASRSTTHHGQRTKTIPRYIDSQYIYISNIPPDEPGTFSSFRVLRVMNERVLKQRKGESIPFYSTQRKRARGDRVHRRGSSLKFRGSVSRGSPRERYHWMVQVFLASVVRRVILDPGALFSFPAAREHVFVLMIMRSVLMLGRRTFGATTPHASLSRRFILRVALCLGWKQIVKCSFF